MGIELTDAQLITVLVALRALLVAQAGLGCLLCVTGIRTAWQDLKWATVGNGGKQIASDMRLKVEVLLLLVFMLNLALSLFYMLSAERLAASAVLLPPVAKGRLLFNAHMFLLLMVKVVMYYGRRRLDQYYDGQAANEVIRQKGLHAHRRVTDSQ